MAAGRGREVVGVEAEALQRQVALVGGPNGLELSGGEDAGALGRFEQPVVELADAVEDPVDDAETALGFERLAKLGLGGFDLFERGVADEVGDGLALADLLESFEQAQLGQGGAFGARGLDDPLELVEPVGHLAEVAGMEPRADEGVLLGLELQFALFAGGLALSYEVFHGGENVDEFGFGLDGQGGLAGGAFGLDAVAEGLQGAAERGARGGFLDGLTGPEG